MPIMTPRSRPGRAGCRCGGNSYQLLYRAENRPAGARRTVHNPDMLPGAADSDDDPLEQDAPDYPADDPAIPRWFLGEGERANRGHRPAGFHHRQPGHSRWSTAALLRPAVRRAQRDRATATRSTSLDFRGDLDERLAGPGTEVGEVLGAAAHRGVEVFGLLWRSQPEGRAAVRGGQRRVRPADRRRRRPGPARRPDPAGRQPPPEAGRGPAPGAAGPRRRLRRRHRPRAQPRRRLATTAATRRPWSFPAVYGPRPPWHDIQAEVRGPAVHDLEHTFRERWYGSSMLDIPSPLRQLYDRAYHIGAMTGRPLPEPAPDDGAPRGTHAVQVLRTYPARLRRYPFAPHGERSIAHAYRKAFARARRLVYLEDQYLWSRPVADVIAAALRANPDLHVIVVVPRYPDNDGPVTSGARRCWPGTTPCGPAQAAGGDRFAVYDLENHAGHAGLRARQGGGRRRRVGDGRLGQPQPAVVDPRQRAVDRRARRRPGPPGPARTRLASATAPGCSPGTCACGCAASTSTGPPDDLPTCWTPRAAFAAFRPPGRRPGGLVRGRRRPAPAARPGAAAPAVRQPGGRAAGVGHPAVPASVRPGRPALAGPHPARL